jgi:hypothetical protein
MYSFSDSSFLIYTSYNSYISSFLRFFSLYFCLSLFSTASVV